MKLERLVLVDVLRFRGRVELDVRDLPPGIIAITGTNGSGKTSLMEIPAGVIYRKLPSRRDGADPVQYASSRASALEMDWTTEGRTYRARVSMDGQTKKSDAVLSVKVGEQWASLTDGKVTTYKPAMQQLFPSFDLWLASAFAAQGKGARFCELATSERQELFAEFLGLRQYAAWAKTAKLAAAAVQASRDRLVAALGALHTSTSTAVVDGMAQREQDLAATKAAALDAQRELRAAIDGLRAQLAERGDESAAFARVQARLSQLNRDFDVAKRALDAATGAVTNGRKAAVQELQDLTRRRDEQLKDIEERRAGNEKILARKEQIRAAAHAIAGIDVELVSSRQTLETLLGRRDAIQVQLTAAQAAVHAFTQPQAELARAKTDSALLTTVPCGGSGDFASCQFLTNATIAAGKIAALEATLAGLTTALAKVDEINVEIAAAVTAVVRVRNAIDQLEQERQTHETAAKYAEPLAAAEARLEELARKRTEVETQTAQLLADAERRHASQDEDMERRSVDAKAKVFALSADLTVALEEQQAIGTAEGRTRQLQTQLEERQAEWDQTIAALATVHAGVDELARRRAEIAEAQTRIRDVEGRVQILNIELVEWETLAKAFSRTGLPDLEIDAAGPTISATANEILAACFGPRFSLELVTQTEKADGGMKSEFTVRVWDNDAGGDWRDISDLSGGEKVIVTEALMNAIAAYVNQRSAHPIQTLWRDETGSALDPENALRYIAMLRKVRELSGAHHVFFVSHNADAAALADAQIQVADGQARLVYPPFEREAA